MVTERKLAANRKNAKKSTGPKDTSKTKFNAVKYGIFAKETFIGLGNDEEGRVEFQEFYDAMFADYAPRGPLEKMLVDDMVSILWRRKRLLTYEAAAIAQFSGTTPRERLEAMRLYRVANGKSPHSAIKTITQGPDLDKVIRVEAHQVGLFYSALRALKELQAIREQEPIVEVVTNTVEVYVNDNFEPLDTNTSQEDRNENE